MMGQWLQRGEGRSRPWGSAAPRLLFEKHLWVRDYYSKGYRFRHRALVTSQLLHCWHLDVKIGLCGSARIRS